MKADGSDVDKALSKQNKPKTVFDMLDQMLPEIQKALPNTEMTRDRFARIYTTAIRMNKKLAKCTWISLIGGMMQSAALGLEINTLLGQCYLIPFWNSNQSVFEAQLTIGYQGLSELCYRSGFYAMITTKEIYENDFFEFEYGDKSILKHKPLFGKPRGNLIGCYAKYTTMQGFSDFHVMSIEEIIEHAKKYSKSWDKEKKCFKKFSAWDIAFPSMCMKTPLRKLLKNARKTPDIETALIADSNVNNGLVENENFQIMPRIDIELQKENEKETEPSDQPEKKGAFDKKAIEFNRNQLKELLESEFIFPDEKEKGLAWLENNPDSKILEKLTEKNDTVEKKIEGRKNKANG